jgi:ATP-dependent Lon protease
VILIDELDKAGWRDQGDPVDVLHSLLEPENAQAFIDAYVEAPIRADHVLWIATANDVSGIRPSLLDRMLPLQIEPPTATQRSVVIRSIYASLGATNYGDAVAADLDEDVVAELAEATPRQVRRLLQLALGCAAEAQRGALAPEDIQRSMRVVNSGSERRSLDFGHPVEQTAKKGVSPMAPSKQIAQRRATSSRPAALKTGDSSRP